MHQPKNIKFKKIKLNKLYMRKLLVIILVADPNPGARTFQVITNTDAVIHHRAVVVDYIPIFARRLSQTNRNLCAAELDGGRAIFFWLSLIIRKVAN